MGRQAAVVGVGGLSGSIFTREIDIADDRIASQADEEWNRHMLELMSVGDGQAIRELAFDFAVPSLRLIVEVKLIRAHRDLHAVETQIAEDLALYFKSGGPFSDMIVYIYDDRDTPQPENYPAVRDALLRRDDRIVDVVIVQRPSMIPDRDARAL